MKLVALHGYTQTGDILRAQLGPLADRLRERIELSFPDAPHECPPESAERLFRTTLGDDRSRWPTHRPLRWWNASDDGSVYAGWDESLERLVAMLTGPSPAAVLGFSQGASVAATLAALSARGELPPLAGVVIVAGRIPRSDRLRPLFEGAPIAVPSLHVWGERDRMSAELPERLAAAFAGEHREIVRWPGGHSVPSSGAAADRILEWITHLGR